MDFDRLAKFVEQWGKVIGSLTAMAALLSIFSANTWVSYVLLIISWVVISLWLWPVAFEKTVRESIEQSTYLPKLPKSYQGYFAAIGLALMTIVVWGWIGSQMWSNARSTAQPTLELFPEDRFGIIIAEFTQGSQERLTFSGGIDARDKLYNDVLRLISQQGLGNQIVVQQAGQIKDQEEALAVGQKYGAELVVWGYIPVDQPNSFRPSFTILAKNEDLHTVDPVLFSAEIIGEDTIEASTLLTTRVRVVSSFVLGVIYMTEGDPRDYQLAISIFDQAIIESSNELAASRALQEDLAFNLALLYLMRGRAYAALGNETSALEDYHRALDYRQNFTRAYAAIGNIYYLQRDFDTALIYYGKAQTNWRGVFGIGLISYHQENYDLAIQHIESAQKMAVEEGVLAGGEIEMRLLFTLGMAYKQAGEWERAEVLLDQLCHSNDISENIQEGACIELTPTIEVANTIPAALTLTALPILTESPTPTLLPPTPTLLPTPAPAPGP